MRGSVTKRFAVLCAAITVGFAFVGCGSDSTPKVSVQLSEYKVNPDVVTQKNGKIEFEVENVGGTTHEFVIVRADSADDLPTKSEGSVDEDKISDDDAIGEVEDVAPKATKKASFELEPGRYVFFCNVVDDSADPPVSHFDQGMHASFTVS
jgi:uncharacterized cupredoxin-like copper-binding protein